jgi:hypothetical protein
MNVILNPFRYKTRIMAQFADHAPIELHRTQDVLAECEVTPFTRELDPAWTTWVERQTPERELISDRPKITAYMPSRDRDPIMLTKEELKQAGDAPPLSTDWN